MENRAAKNGFVWVFLASHKYNSHYLCPTYIGISTGEPDPKSHPSYSFLSSQLTTSLRND